MLPFALGRQIAVDFFDCRPELLNDSTAMKNICERAARDAGATIISSSFQHFTPQGVSGVVVIAESHFALHAWPEYKFAALDIFTCSEKVDFNIACKKFASDTGAGYYSVRNAICRGELKNGLPQKCESMDFQSALSVATPSWEKIYTTDNAIGMTLLIDISDCANLEANGSFTDSFSIPRETMTVHRSPARRSVSIDIYTDKFVEPRAVSEAALQEFQGSRYTLQVILRH